MIETLDIIRVLFWLWRHEHAIPDHERDTHQTRLEELIVTPVRSVCSSGDGMANLTRGYKLTLVDVALMGNVCARSRVKCEWK